MQNRLVLIDGHAILHRAYHALPLLTGPGGKVINAVYGFTTMLLRVLEDLKSTYLAVAFDLTAPTFRQQAYTAYQARRPEMASDLSDQIPLVHKMLEALQIPYFEVAGYEADDVIGTLAAQAAQYPVSSIQYLDDGKEIQNTGYRIQNTPLEVIIVTGDRDMLQLVNSHVKVCVPVKGLTETKIYDKETVVSEFGVEPSQWVDVKALKGDASDNYPGVAGIGPKTAQDLIAKYDSLENLYQHLDELQLKPKLKLAEGAEEAGMAKKLAQIVTDVPTVKLDLDSSRVDRIDWKAGVEYMRRELGFKTIVKRIEENYLNKDNKSINQLPNKKEDREAGDGQMKLI